MAKANQGMNSVTQQMQGLSTEDRRGGRNNGRDNGQRGSRPNAGRQGQGQATDDKKKERRNLLEVVDTRPEKYKLNKCGTGGTVVKLKANYFPITPIKKGWDIYQYRVDFLPDIEETFIRKALLRPYRNEFNGYVFDGTMLFTSSKLKDDKREILTNRTNGDKITIVIKYVGNIPAETALQVLNCILRAAMDGLNLQLIRRNYFDLDVSVVQKIENQPLKLIPGYITSIRQHERNILMCAELTSKVMRTESVLQMFGALVKNCRGNENPKDKFEKEVLGMIVMTSYNNKTYKVDEVNWDANPMSTFGKKDKTFMTYKDYYAHKFNLKINDLKQPLLLSIPTEKQQRGGETGLIYLVPELCIPTGFTDSMRKDFRLMRAVADKTRVGPRQRVERLLQMNNRIRSAKGSQVVLNDWHVQLASNLVEFEGREQAPENILFGPLRPGGAPEEVKGSFKADWTQNLLQKRLYAMSTLNNWVVITSKVLERDTQKFLQTLGTSVASIGWKFAPPKLLCMPDERPLTITDSLRKARNVDPQIIMVVVEKQSSYSIIKKFCCVQQPILSQVVTRRVITQPDHKLKSICTKIGIQMNCKLGAIPWLLKLPLGGMMTVGFDVCHDTADKTKSFGALVASMDMRTSMRYFSAATPHKDGTELSANIKAKFSLALDAYKEEHGTLPAHIVFYRDGVGEGQLRHVYDVEVKQLRDLLQERDPNIQFTFVIVCKRINTRIFKGFDNPAPGTVVDDVITLPERYDFFLVSQLVTQGTASPTSYNVIYDTSKMLTPARLQMLTFKMCHLYYNWSGTVRVPAVCQYAHKLSLLMGQFVHEQPSATLSKTLYFL